MNKCLYADGISDPDITGKIIPASAVNYLRVKSGEGLESGLRARLWPLLTTSMPGFQAWSIAVVSSPTSLFQPWLPTLYSANSMIILKRKPGLYHFCAHGFPISFRRSSLPYLPLYLHLLTVVSWFPPLQPQWPCWCPGAVQARSCPGPFHLFPLPRALSAGVHVVHSLATFDPCSEITFSVMPSWQMPSRQ